LRPARLHLTFPAHLVQEPVIYRLGHEFGLVTNIKRANIDEKDGWVILEVEGDQETVARAVAWLTDQGIQVDRILEEQEPA
jgi:L-aspartate semialdehyde sulfurtransferase ferredoxin